MKFNILYLKIVFVTTILLVVVSELAFSQKTRFGSKKSNDRYPSISLGVSYSKINIQPTMAISGLHYNEMVSFPNGSLEYHIFWNKVGVSAGFEYDFYKTRLNLDSYQNKIESTDSEGEKYEKQISGRSIEEIQKVGFINLPVCLNFRPSLGSKSVFLFKAGIKIAKPVVNKYESKGIFTYKGYYAQYPVTLENLPDHGFQTDLNSKSEGKMELRKYPFFLITSVEIEFTTGFALCLKYSRSLSKLSAYTAPETFQLSNEPNQINSLMGSSSKVSSNYFGGSLSWRFYKK